jgi:hypothetical protein
MRAYPQGLEDIDHSVVQRLRTAYDEWREDLGHRTRSVATHQAWIGYILRGVLELPDTAIAEGQAIPDTLRATVPEYGETLRPTHMVRDPADGKPRMLVAAYPPGRSLDRPVLDKRWKASPATRMTELLHATGIRVGLITNGEHWMLVDAPRDDTSGFTSWSAEMWFEERLTLRAFRSLLGAQRFFGVATSDTLDALLAESAQSQQEVTDQLGYQVRRAVEVLVSALDRADQDHGRKLLAGVPETEIYESALTVMMRLVFLFCAEERELLLLGDPAFDQHYAVSPLREQLRQAADQHGEEVLERRHDAWCRLLATFRAVHGGVRHERMTIPPYGGQLFDPDRFPFLEGRMHGSTWRASTADPLPVSNRTVLHLLEALQLLQVKVPGGGAAEARRLSFRALDIEQIGHVYEGLLDHTAKRATDVTLGLAGSRAKTRDYEPEVPLSRLESLSTKGRPTLVDFLVEETRRSAKAIEKHLDRPLSPGEEQRLQVACGGGAQGEALLVRVRPFAGLVRLDSFGCPIVIHAGSVYVTEGIDRRSTGTQYTPRSLTEPVVQHALEPLVYDGTAEGKPRAEWKLRSARELLALAICDFACGSGAFLVQACRYLAARLLEAWEAIEHQNPGVIRITPDGGLSQGLPEERLIPKDPGERLTYAMRLVAQRCLYGVDVNPLAVEMAKLSMWLLTLAKEKPFTFLDHNVRCGDSLLGITSLDQLKRFSLAEGPVQMTIWQQVSFDELVDQAITARLRIESMDGDTIEHVAAQKGLLAEAEDQIRRLKAVADQLIAVELGDVSRDDAITVANSILTARVITSSPVVSGAARAGRPPFHWPLEFPEVVVRRQGFDSLLFNPPFVGGAKISGSLGRSYLLFLKSHFSSRQNTDLCAYFFQRALVLGASHLRLGFLATKSIAESDTREASLHLLGEMGGRIYRARPRVKWPGAASVLVSAIWVERTASQIPSILDELPVSSISPYLTVGAIVEVNPFRLLGPVRSYKGVTVVGTDLFTVTPEERDLYVADDIRNDSIIKPYLVGADIAKQIDALPSRLIIDFGDMSEEEAQTFRLPFQHVNQRVRPFRMTVNRMAHRKRWWQYGDVRQGLRGAICDLSRVLVSPQTTKYLTFVWCPVDWVFDQKCVVYATSDDSVFALLSSSIFDIWTRKRCGTQGETLSFSPTDAFETLPFPPRWSELTRIGALYSEHRGRILKEHQLGLTATYNRLHDPSENSAEFSAQRELKRELDTATALSYGWDDLALDHAFHATREGIRYTISSTARTKILDRLLELNHQRHAEDVRSGPKAKGAPARFDRKGKRDADDPSSLFS